MDLPATYYGKLDKRNPVVIAFLREINSFIAVMKKLASSPAREDNTAYVKGIKICVEIWKKYKSRLPPSFYHDHMLQVADVLFQIKFYDMALWYGYRPHVQQFTSVDILDFKDVDHFKASLFPKGLDTDQDALLMKIRALYGCALCTFEQVKAHHDLTPDGLCKLLCVLNLIQIIMQVFQHYDGLCWQMYNGSVLIYNICLYLMTNNYSAQALDYLLWASISIELSVPLMTSKNVPWLVTLYCTVCQCYYDNQDTVKGEVFARRALVKITELLKLEEQCGIPASKETRRAYKEASIKLVTMVFKRAVFEARIKTLRYKIKKDLSDIPNAPWPRTTTEKMLSSLFDGGAAQFLAVLEALRDSRKLLPTAGGPGYLEGQEVVLELLAAGISLLSESEPKNDCQSSGSLCAVTSSSSLLDLAIAGESKICFEAAVEFIKLLYYNKQPEAFSEYSRKMLQLLSCLKGLSSETAELELGLLYYYSCVQKAEKQKVTLAVSEEFNELVKTLHKYVCDSGSELNRDLVLSVILFIWEKIASVIDCAHRPNLDSEKLEKWAWCVSVLCEVAFAFEPCTTHHCLLTGEMTLKFAMLLESASKGVQQKSSPKVSAAEGDAGIVNSLSLSKSSRIQLLQNVCSVVKKCLVILSKGMSTMLPQDGSTLIDTAYMEKYGISSSTWPSEEGNSEDSSAHVETSKHTWSRGDFLLVVDLHFHLSAIYYRAFLGLVHDHAAAESEILQQIKKNKVYKAVYLMQTALMEYNMDSSIKNLLEESAELIRRAGSEEKKLYMSTVATSQSASSSSSSSSSKRRGFKDKEDCPPPPPVLISRSDHSLSFVPAPYNPNEKVCWYQLLGHAAEDSTNTKVRLGDCSLSGTGSLISAESDRCVLKAEGLDPNQKYVFAVAAYNSQGELVSSSVGETTIPLLASPPLPLLTSWAYLAQVAFQTKQYDVAKTACQKVWSHFTSTESRTNIMQYELFTPRLQVTTLSHSSLALRHSVFASIFIETEMNMQCASLQFDQFSDRGLFIWEQVARLEECERMLVAIDLTSWLTDPSDAVQAVLVCYALVSPLIYHQIPCDPVIQVLTKCLNVVEKNLHQLKHKWTGSASEALMQKIACITYYLYKALHNLNESEKAAVTMDCGINLIQEIYDAQNEQINKAVVSVKQASVQKCEMKMSPQLKALRGKKKIKISENVSKFTFSEDHSKMYDVVSSAPIRHVFQEVMKLRQKTLFIELSSLLLERALEEGEAALVIEWGNSFIELLRKVKGAAHIHEDDAKRKASEKWIRKKMSCFRKQVMLRQMYCEESVWKTNLNYVVAQAHLALFYQGLEQLQQRPPLHRYSQLDPLSFSMAYTGVSLSMRKNPQQQQASRSDPTLQRDTTTEREPPAQTDLNEENGSTVNPEVLYEMQKQTAAAMLVSLTNAALHLHRAMVLAHRNSHWAILRTVAQTTWDQYCRTACIAQRGLHLDLPAFITSEQQLNIFRPLLVLATRLIMDMLNQLGLWSVYEKDISEEDTHSYLYFSPSLDETTKIDMRWVSALVIHTLEQLHDFGKWETLAHLALHFNTYTRDCYALIVSPLLITAQRKLLKRIESLKGPLAPQPHHVKTTEVTGREVTYRSYVDVQLLSGWTSTLEKTTVKKEAPSRDQLIEAEVQRSKVLVCVPLDVEDTLYWYRKAVEKTSPCLRFFQHSRSQLQRLLANTQSCFTAQGVRSREPSRLESQVEFNPVVITAPTVKPCDLMEKEYKSVESLYSVPFSPDQVSTITAAYTTAIKYFHENKCDSLTVVAMHELGNLHYYNSNTKAAHACWTKAVNVALKIPDAFERWDGVTFGDCSLQHRLKVSGVWGCLHAACLTAKIAQYILTDISKRTDSCLQSAHLFKCVLCCSLAQPQSDLYYASDVLIEDLLPGVDLFSDSSRLHLGTAVASLSFICHWLFSTGHYMKLLPMLSLYFYLVGSVCRDVQRTVQCKILKIRALTELGLFSEAVRETLLLSKGGGIRLPQGHYIQTHRDHAKTTFNSSHTILENMEALKELLNCDVTPPVCALYGSALCLQFKLAQAQLILAISSTVSSPLEVPETENQTSDSKNKREKTQNCSILSLESLQEPLTAGMIKYELLESVSSSLKSILNELRVHGPVGTEDLTVECSLLKAKLCLLKGEAALSAEMAMSALMFLKSTSDITNENTSVFEEQTASEGGTARPRVEGDCVEVVEASERISSVLWIRCRLTLAHILTAHDVTAGAGPGDKLRRGTARVMREGIEECKRWGDPDSEALLMLEAAHWDKSSADKSDQVKEVVSLLSGCLSMPPRSSITLARAALLLHDMKTPESIPFLKLSQKLLQNQVKGFSQSIVVDAEGFQCSTCLPFLHLLHHTTSCIGQIIDSQMYAASETSEEKKNP